MHCVASLRACEELGIEPLEDDIDPVAFAVAANQRRRNLTNNSQLAMCAAKMAGLKHGSNQHKREGVPNGTPNEEDKLAAEEAGKVLDAYTTAISTHEESLRR